MFLICGEALFDVFFDAGEQTSTLRLDAHPGGSPFNVAKGISRLGGKSALLTGVSSDLWGQRLHQLLVNESVSTDYLVRSPQKTTLSLVGTDSEGQPSYVFYGDNTADRDITAAMLPELGDEITGIHFGSYSLVAQPVSDALKQLASQAENRFISLDPNVRLNVEPDLSVWHQQITEFARYANLIKVSSEDLELLYPNTPPAFTAQKWLDAGVDVVVITDGSDHVSAWTQAGVQAQVAPPNLDVIDTVGAGDTFQSALLTRIDELQLAGDQIRDIDAATLTELLCFAASAAALTCTRRGADLPTRSELSNKKQNSAINTAATAWSRVKEHGERLSSTHLKMLFSDNPNRFEHLSLRLDDTLYDFSKERIDKDALHSLLQLAKSSGLEEKRAALFKGEKINITEDRAVLHMALRGGVNDNTQVDGSPVIPLVNAEKERFLAFAEAVREGTYTSVTGQVFTDVINIGIGGSDLGPAMVTQALAPWNTGPQIHCVSNVDSSHIIDTVRGLNPETTLVIIASKTFTTSETMQNFDTAVEWLKEALGDKAEQHLVAVSTHLESTRSYGIPDERVFGFWDWVGGRYSVWSSIGLPIAIAVGKDMFEAFLSGARSMDEHFQNAPLEENLPVIMALIGIWRRNIMGCQSVALIPYDQRLARFPAYVQQLDMESNGKRTTLSGTAVPRACGPLIWGEPGTNAQHSFFQLIHQGEDIIPVDFLVAARPSNFAPYANGQQHHDTLLCNVFAQSQALAFGRTLEDVREEMQQSGADRNTIESQAVHRSFPGNRPSSTLMYEQLNPFQLGRLIALFEHKVFVQGVIWNINSYDQWGVELGKKLAKNLASAVSSGTVPSDMDASTKGLLGHLNQLRG